MREGKPLNMADLEALYIDVLHENDVAIPSCCRKTLKQLISSQIPMLNSMVQNVQMSQNVLLLKKLGTTQYYHMKKTIPKTLE